jgi:hypothetical protein
MTGANDEPELQILPRKLILSSGVVEHKHISRGLQQPTLAKLGVSHERTTTAKNMGILKYHQTSLISNERDWPLACLEYLIKPNRASHQGAR